MSFLPESYKDIPQSQGHYAKLKEGENNFRIVSSAIVGYEYWTKENKPTRSKTQFKTVPQDIKDGGTIKHFWAFVIYNYDDKQIQVMEITQKTIMTSLKNLIDSPKWGDPKNYDITITRQGQDLDTTYTVLPSPHSELPEDIKTQVEKMKINLEALYTGDDPFADNDMANEIEKIFEAENEAVSE